MKLIEAAKKIHEKGLSKTLQYCKTKVSTSTNKCIKILLLTNCNSDNVGDQVIEACNISLLKTIMKNLNKECTINSSANSIIPNKYLKTKDEELLKSAEKAVKEADIVIFGGAPMFNYTRRNFSEKTATVLEIAQKYGKPVLLSAIGIESYDENHPKCQRLKTALNYECVKLVTTRDDFVSLQKYKSKEDLMIGKVSDSAVFSTDVFSEYKVSHKKNAKKKIGIFVLRHNGFVDNNIPFPKKEAITLWLKLAKKLKKKGYRYEFVTSGHCGDEAVLDDLIRRYNVDLNKCVFNMESPEKLIAKISSYDAIVSCRLHPSIIAYSLGVPSLGIVWNSKVNGFYNSIGYEDRIIDTKDIDAAAIVDKLEKVMAEGVKREEDFIMTIYHSLFQGIIKALGETDIKHPEPYSYETLKQTLPAYQPVSAQEQEERYVRKFRRIYGLSNTRLYKIDQLKKAQKS